MTDGGRTLLAYALLAAFLCVVGMGLSDAPKGSEAEFYWTLAALVGMTVIPALPLWLADD